MSGTTRTPYPLLNKPGGRPVLAGAGKGALLSGPAGGTTGGTGGTGSTGTGGTGGTGTGTPGVVAGSPTLPTTLRVKALVGGVPTPTVCWHGFGPGHVPAGSRPRLRAADGTEIPSQTDSETYWADGSLCGAELSFVAPAAAAGTVHGFTLDAVAGAPDRTPSATLSTVTGESDFAVQASRHNFGADTFRMRVNDVIAQGIVGTWGTNNPTMGIEVVASGRQRMEWRFWAYARRVSDGAIHRSVVLEAYVRRWAGKAYEIVPCQWQPNLFDAHPSGTVGAFKQGYAGALETFDGTTRIAACGGPNDRDARTVAAGAFDASTGRYTWPAGQNIGTLDWTGSYAGGGVSVGMSGNLPGGISATDVLYAVNASAGSTQFTRTRNRADLPVSFTAPGGNVAVYPLAHSFPGSGVVGMDADAEPIWRAVAGGAFAGLARPRVLVGLDEAYLTRATRLVFPIDTTLDRPAEPGTPIPYRPGQVYLQEETWDLQYFGDNWYHDRIGWMSRQSANLVLTPFDEVRLSFSRRLALMQADFPWNWRNEETGRQPALNYGPDGAGAAYPQLGAPFPELFLHYQDGPGNVSPGRRGFAAWKDSPVSNGYKFPYDLMNDGSHQPNYLQMPYMLTGHRVYRDMFRNMVFACWASANPYYSRNATLGGRNYRGIVHGQDRLEGWHTLAASLLRMLMPAGDPERPMLEDLWRDHVEFYAALATVCPGRHLGLLKRVEPPWDGTNADWIARTDWCGRQFQLTYKIFGFTAALYRGDERIRPAVEVFARYMRDQFDDTLYPNGTGYGAGRYDNNYNPDGSNAPGGLWGTLGELARSNAGGSGPYPERGLRDYDGKSPLWDFYDPAADPGPASFGTDYSVQQCATLALMDWVGIAGAKRVRQQLMNRVMARPNGVVGRSKFPMSSNQKPGEMVVQWSVLPTGI